FNETQRTQLERLKERFSEIEKVNQSNIGESRSENSPQPVYLPMGNEEEFVSVADLQDAATRESEVLEEIQNSLNQTVDHLKSPFRVDQQGTDSCFALAWLEGMDPGAVERMIHDNEDGSVTVTFPGDPEHPVTIQKPNEGEKAQFTLGNAGLIEKALGQYLSELSPEEREKYQTEPREGQKPILVQHELSPGGEPAAVMELLTGRDAKSTQLLPGMSEDSIHEALTQATKIDQIITAGTQDLIPGDIGMQPRHAYHVTYNPETRMVTLTNPSKPVGSYVGEPTKPDGTAADGNADGSFEIPLSEFKARMIGIYTGARL
ncbi:MAG: hypothetical protein K2Z81_23135, partial [Cyanobacteria bacterium]|nr:hypothetical protein [Cyanobacteriota bacterium]